MTSSNELAADADKVKHRLILTLDKRVRENLRSGAPDDWTLNNLRQLAEMFKDGPCQIEFDPGPGLTRFGTILLPGCERITATWMNGEPWFPGYYAEPDFSNLPTPDDLEADDSRVTSALALVPGGVKVNNKSEAADTHKNALGALQASRLHPAYNEMARRIEFVGDVPWDGRKYGRVLDDNLLTVIRLYLMGLYQGNDYDPSLKNIAEALAGIAQRNRFNPARDYLAKCEAEWDGVPRIEGLFGKYLNCGIDDYTRGVSVAFMVGAVTRIRRPGCKFDTLPVLRGPQGWNKSTAFRTLFGDSYFSDTHLGNLTQKDAPMKLRGIWCHEFSEVGSLRKHDIDALKAFVSSQSDRNRDPYERLVADVPRSNVFVATVNEGGALGDATGGRRFWPMELIARIDLAALAADRDQLWGEAAAREAAGESCVLPEELWPVAGERQQAETIDDPWTDTLREYLDGGGPVRDLDDLDDVETLSPVDKVHAADLYAALGIPPKDQNRATGGRLRTVMESRLGWRHKTSIRMGDSVRAGFERL
jgi:predicted P-loop ATPase